MVRRTKEDALVTRRAIIAAAREMFSANGVTRTSLEQIAVAAGVTRGAIYWHFADKAELFYAMRDEVQIPLVDRSDIALEACCIEPDPLARIERFLGVIVEQLQGDEATQKTFEIMTFKCEYVGEFARDLEGACAKHTLLRDKLARLYHEARRKKLLRAGVSPLCAASDTLVFLSGLVKLWVVDETGTMVRKHAHRLVVDHIESKRATPPPAPARARANRKAATPLLNPVAPT